MGHITAFPAARDTRPLSLWRARAHDRLESRTSRRRRFRSKHTTSSNMFTVAYGPDSTALVGFVRTFIALAHAYYLLCIAFGALAFVPEPVATRMPRILQIFRNVLLNSMGRGKTYDHKSALRLGKGLNGIVIQLLVSRRLYENYFVHAHSSEGRMQLFGYAFGLLYYVFLPANFFTPGVVRSLDL